MLCVRIFLLLLTVLLIITPWPYSIVSLLSVALRLPSLSEVLRASKGLIGDRLSKSCREGSAE